MYKILNLIHKGGHGKIYNAYRLYDNDEVIIKIVKKRKINFWKWDYANRKYIPYEIFTLQKLENVEGVQQLLDYKDKDNCYWLIMQKYKNVVNLKEYIRGSAY